MDSLPLLFTCVVGYFVISASLIDGAAFHSTDKCPDNMREGDSWYPGGCEKCTCDHIGYSCYTCGVAVLNFDQTSCYKVPNTEERYPKCCTPTIKCRGDEDFDESFLFG